MIEQTLRERMEERKENFNLRIQTYTDMVGTWLTRTAPMMSQAVSALTVGFAMYEGLYKHLNSHFVVAIIAGVVAAWALEGTGFMAVDERDKSEAYNRRTQDDSRRMDTGKTNAYVTSSFLITFAIVAFGEAIPAMIGWYNGVADMQEVVFRCSFLLFPFLARLGAQLFAIRAVREMVDTSTDDLELRKLKLDLAKQELVAKSNMRIAKVSGKLSEKVSEKVSQKSSPEVESFPPDSSESLGRQIVVYLKNNPGALLSEVAAHVGWSEPKVSKEISSLIDMGVLHAEKQGRRKVVTVNGNHEQYLAS